MNKVKTYYYHYDGMFESDDSIGDDLYVRLEDFEHLHKENETLKTCLFQMQNCAMELTKENEELKKQNKSLQMQNEVFEVMLAAMLGEEIGAMK